MRTTRECVLTMRASEMVHEMLSRQAPDGTVALQLNLNPDRDVPPRLYGVIGDDGELCNLPQVLALITIDLDMGRLIALPSPTEPEPEPVAEPTLSERFTAWINRFANPPRP